MTRAKNELLFSITAATVLFAIHLSYKVISISGQFEWRARSPSSSSVRTKGIVNVKNVCFSRSLFPPNNEAQPNTFTYLLRSRL